jgi:hypothetical protein
VVFFEHKGLFATRGEVPDGEYVDRLGTANVLRRGGDITMVALAAMVPRSLAAADRLEREHGISATVIDVRSLVPLDTRTILEEVSKTGRLYTIEENPRLCGWGAEVVSIVAEECFYDLDGPIVRITTPHVPLPAAEGPRADGRRHAAAGRDRARGHDLGLAQEGRRQRPHRRAAVRGRDRQGDDGHPCTRGRRAGADPGPGRRPRRGRRADRGDLG